MTETAKKHDSIFVLIPKIMADIGAVGKGQENKFDHYQFRGIDDLYNAVQPAMIKHGVFCVPTILETTVSDFVTTKGTKMLRVFHKVKYTFCAADESTVEAVVAGEAMDRGDKASNKAMSAAMKYALQQVFCIPTEGDNDSENNSPQIGSGTASQKLPDIDMAWLTGDKVAAWMRGFNPPTADAVIRQLSTTNTVQNAAHAYINEFFQTEQQK